LLYALGSIKETLARELGLNETFSKEFFTHHILYLRGLDGRLDGFTNYYIYNPCKGTSFSYTFYR
jgi:hypothetical protein